MCNQTTFTIITIANAKRLVGELHTHREAAGEKLPHPTGCPSSPAHTADGGSSRKEGRQQLRYKEFGRPRKRKGTECWVLVRTSFGQWVPVCHRVFQGRGWAAVTNFPQKTTSQSDSFCFNLHVAVLGVMTPLFVMLETFGKTVRVAVDQPDAHVPW